MCTKQYRLSKFTGVYLDHLNNTEMIIYILREKIKVQPIYANLIPKSPIEHVKY